MTTKWYRMPSGAYVESTQVQRDGVEVDVAEVEEHQKKQAAEWDAIVARNAVILENTRVRMDKEAAAEVKRIADEKAQIKGDADRMDEARIEMRLMLAEMRKLSESVKVAKTPAVKVTKPPAVKK